MLSGISRCAVVCSVPVVADAAPFSSLELSSDCSSGSCGSRSGCDHFASRASGPSCAPMLSHSAAASRMRLGRNCMPIRLSNVRSAGPPMARSRRNISRSCSICGICAMPARHTTASTQPSTKASRFSNAFMACFCSGVSGNATLVMFTALAMESGSMDSASRICSSMASMSMVMPRAYLPSSASKRGISHGTEANSLACASSCSAR